MDDDVQKSNGKSTDYRINIINTNILKYFLNTHVCYLFCLLSRKRIHLLDPDKMYDFIYYIYIYINKVLLN